LLNATGFSIAHEATSPPVFAALNFTASKLYCLFDKLNKPVDLASFQAASMNGPAVNA